MKFEEWSLKYLFLVKSFSSVDERGNFVKNFHKELFIKESIGNYDFRELFYSSSNKNVIRGMHFQIPPRDHSKLVFVMEGSLLDVVIDLRKNSKTFGQHHSQKLNYEDNQALIIPSGFAHGFLSLEDNTKMVYLVSKEHSVEHDCGIKWDSFGFSWPCKNPIISKRDNNFEKFEDILKKSYF